MDFTVEHSIFITTTYLGGAFINEKVLGKPQQLVYHQFRLLYLEEEVKYRVSSQRCRRVEHFSDTVSVVPGNSPGRSTHQMF
jgi:hypothetical protein